MISVDIFLPGPFNEKAFEEEFVRALRQTNDAVHADFEQTVRSWRTNVVFSRRVTIRPNEIVGDVLTDSDIYKFVTRGTAVRFAVMTDDFQPKTIPGVIGSFPGRGGFSHLDFANPRPGIIARRFEETIKRKFEKPIVRKMQVALNRAIDRSGHRFV